MIEKLCSRCGQTKSGRLYYADSSKRDGLSAYCKDCARVRAKENQRRRSLDFNISDIPAQKLCSMCGITKSSADFQIRKCSSDSLQSYCRACSVTQYERRLSKVAASSIPSVIEKTCITCGITKLSEDFSKSSIKTDGLNSECRDCSNSRVTKNRSIRLENDSVSYRINAMMNAAKHRSRKQGTPCDLDIQFMRSLYTPTCPALGIPLNWNSKKISRNSPTLDKFFPELGYTKANVRIISHKANSMKNDGDVQDILNLAVWAVSTELEIKRALDTTSAVGAT